MIPRRFLSVLLCALPCLASFAGGQSTGLTYERWTSIPGNSLESFRKTGINTRTPNHSGTVSLAESPSNTADNQGSRLRGQLIAPVTGDYTFFVSGDDNVELWLAHNPALDTSAPWNRQLIAWHRHFSSLRLWNKYRTQRSQVIRLQGGQSYYLEALGKEATGADHLSVGWHRVEAGTLATTSWSALDASLAPQTNGSTDFSIASGDIWGTKDRGAFHHQAWTGDGIFTLEISSLNNPHLWAKPGLMIRESTSEVSRNAFLVRRTGTNGIVLQCRLTNAGTSTQPASSSNNWNHLQLQRTGDTITSRISPDGVRWTHLATTTFTNLAATIYVGFASSSNTGTSTPLTGRHGPLIARATSTSDPVAVPPAPFGTMHWQPNSATWHPQSDGSMSFTVASGDLWGTADRASFHGRQ